MLTSLLLAWPIELLVIVYLISMYFLIRLFAKTFAIIRKQPGNGLEFYRRLVAITIVVTMIDATYAISVRIIHWFYPLDDYILYGIVPIVIKTLIVACIWGFYTTQLGIAPSWISWKYWKEKVKSIFS